MVCSMKLIVLMCAGLSSITTFPKLPEYRLARNFSGLKLKSSMVVLTNYENCSWRYNEFGENLLQYQDFIFSKIGDDRCCRGSDKTENYIYSCTRRQNQLDFAVSIFKAITENITFLIWCNDNQHNVVYQDNITLHVAGATKEYFCRKFCYP